VRGFTDIPVQLERNATQRFATSNAVVETLCERIPGSLFENIASQMASVIFTASNKNHKMCLHLLQLELYKIAAA